MPADTQNPLFNKRLLCKQTIGMSKELYQAFIIIEKKTKVRMTDHMRQALSEYIRKPEFIKLFS
jgi:hypothetical protein